MIVQCGLCPFYHFHFSEQRGHWRECGLEFTLPEPARGDTGDCQAPDDCPFVQGKRVVVARDAEGDIAWDFH